MAQTQAIPTQALHDFTNTLSGETVTAAGAKMVGIKTSCTADKDQTYAGITESTESGLTLAVVDSVGAADAVITAVKEFTFGEAATVKGFAATNDAATPLISGICCFAADVSGEKDDKLKCTMTWTLSDETA